MIGNSKSKEVEEMEQEKNIMNGTMANNMEDLIFLGKQMERMRDGSQLEEDMRFPDPIQFDDLDDEEKELLKRNN